MANGYWDGHDYAADAARRMRDHEGATRHWKDVGVRNSIQEWAQLAVRDALTLHIHMLGVSTLSEPQIEAMAAALSAAAINVVNSQ